MPDEPQQVARDEWQTALYEAAYRYSVALRDLRRTSNDDPMDATEAVSVLGA